MEFVFRHCGDGYCRVLKRKIWYDLDYIEESYNIGPTCFDYDNYYLPLPQAKRNMLNKIE